MSRRDSAVAYAVVITATTQTIVQIQIQIPLCRTNAVIYCALTESVAQVGRRRPPFMLLTRFRKPPLGLGSLVGDPMLSVVTALVNALRPGGD